MLVSCLRIVLLLNLLMIQHNLKQSAGIFSLDLLTSRTKWSLWSLGNSVFNMISYREAIAVVGLPFNVSGLFGE